ncbi:alpha/beta fold hydrolase [Pseudorhodoferax sp. Leaf267]|uniref:alpha/beta fold hydrolase n=1 Tax=Pseudorhodoferax sp. Leaf267 TaxID=1736316 RepID=UPI0006F32CC4|nr:alpha/beta fold hydrolase [Pseudorhodoferax sp. Leaf267]KQP19252.1 alpha/beta hydrolase [Pseudorhodoferax sp. Leaf267]
MSKLILIPGLACDAGMWRDQLPGLTPDWHAEVTDVATRCPSIEAMAAALLAEHAGALVLCGASMGGMVAMEAAHQAPDRIRGLALLGTSARPETPDMQALREQAIALFEQGRAEEVLRANVAFAFDRQHPDLKALAARYFALILRAGTDQLVRQNRAVIARPDARQHLRQVRCPTLVVTGLADSLTPPDCAREIAGLVPGAELHLVPRCGHMLTMEQPDAVNALLQGWLARLPAAT